MNRCTGHRDIPEILLKTVLNTTQSFYSFAAIVLKLCRYIDHVLRLSKIKFSTIHSLWFKDYLP